MRTNPIYITGVALFMFTLLLFSLTKEGFQNIIPDEKKGGLTCPPYYDWETDAHDNCTRTVEGGSVWTIDPICPSPKVFSFASGSCKTEDEAAQEENMYYIIAGVAGLVLGGVISYFIPALTMIITLIAAICFVGALALTIYIKSRGNGNFLSLKRTEVTHSEYWLQFATIVGYISGVCLFCGTMAGSAAAERA